MSTIVSESEWHGLSWQIPDRFNIGVDVCDKWANFDPKRVALVELRESGGLRQTNFETLRALSNRLANLLCGLGLRREDRVAVLAPQRLETAIAHVAGYKAGAIVVPLFTLFGLDALHHRLRDSGARFVLADRQGLAKLRQITDLPALEHVLAIDADGGHSGLLERLTAFDSAFEPVDTAADDPALIIYTSGTTGSSKGALHAHRVLLGHLPGVEMSHDGFPKAGDCMWTPADWAWIGGLLDVLLPSLHHGVPVVAHRFSKFNAEAAFALMSRCGVRNTFLPPTALKMLRAAPVPEQGWKLALRSVASGGETLGGELLAWGREVLGVHINEFYGQTECNMIVSSCSARFAPRTGSIGRAVPGHNVAIIDVAGTPVPPGAEGEIAVLRPDPVMFLGYWQLPQATEAKYTGDWLRTGDIGVMDEDGYIRFIGRTDDVITSAGYRIGPGEIEDCLLRHPDVQSAGVVGVADDDRTEAVTAFIVLKTGHSASSHLAAELQEHVRSHMGAHQYPRRVYFLDALPMTATGKILRRELRELAVTPIPSTSHNAR